MTPGIPTIGVRFDLEKVDVGWYGFACWKLFWNAIPPGDLRCAVLFEGDSAASMNDSENVFCIAAQSEDKHVVLKVKKALTLSPAYWEVAATPRFVVGDECTREPLVRTGEIDGEGNLVGGESSARKALASVTS